MAARIAELLAEAGLPDGLFNVLYGDHELGAAICRHPGIAKISLTGGVETGKLILEQSAGSLKKVTLELVARLRCWFLPTQILIWPSRPH